MILFGTIVFKAGFEPKILFKSTQWDFMSEMVAARLGITILPESISGTELTMTILDISTLPLSIPWESCCYYKKGQVYFERRTNIY